MEIFRFRREKVKGERLKVKGLSGKMVEWLSGYHC